jgi:hypothetical protein
MTKLCVMRPLSKVLTSVTLELSDLARSGEALERLVIHLTPKADLNDKALMYEVQGIDLFIQRLDGLAAFVAGLSEVVSADVSVDVLAPVRNMTLTDQAERLTGGPRDSREETDGDCLLFED